MNRQAVLTQAIQKAIANGMTGYWADRYNRCKELDEMDCLVAGNIYEEEHSPEELLYSHDFAKSLWGEEEHDWDGEGYLDLDWQYHLKEMVIADDPIEYLAKTLTV